MHISDQNMKFVEHMARLSGFIKQCQLFKFPYLHINARGVEKNDGQDVAHQPQCGDHRDGQPLNNKLHVSQAVLLSLPLGFVHAVHQLHRIVLSPNSVVRV